MIRLSLMAVLVAACSSPGTKPTTSPTSPTNVAPSDSTIDAGAAKVGDHGAVCALGGRHEQDSNPPAVVECSPGLSCCYPCGEDGCDSICMTPAECAVKRP